MHAINLAIVSDVLFGQNRFSFGNLTHDVFLTKGELV